MKMEIKKIVLKNNINNLNDFLSHYELKDFNTDIFIEKDMEKIFGSNPNLSTKLLFLQLKSSYLMNGGGSKELIIAVSSMVVGGIIAPLISKFVPEFVSGAEREKIAREEKRIQERHESDLLNNKRKTDALVDKYNEEARKYNEDARYKRLKSEKLVRELDAVNSANKSMIGRVVNYWYNPKPKDK